MSKLMSVLLMSLNIEFSFGVIENFAIASLDSIRRISGHVIVDYGSLFIHLDLSSWPSLPDGFSQCIADGLEYHIHDQPCFGGLGVHGACGSCGEHFDPMGACGSHSANPHCVFSPNANEFACIDPGNLYDCTPNRFNKNPYQCEVGDWSGKYGKININRNTWTATVSNGSFFDVIPSDLINTKSVVFHCANSGKEAFCAPFKEGNGLSFPSKVPPQPFPTRNVQSTFPLSSVKSSTLIFNFDGTVIYDLQTVDNINSLSKYTDCKVGDDYIFDISIWEIIDKTKLNNRRPSLLDTDCNDALSVQWDPTNQCFGHWSSSSLCNKANNKLCSDPNYEYKCSPHNNPKTGPNTNKFECSPGDLSGKFGPYSAVNFGLNNAFIGTSSRIPLTTTFIDGSKAIAIHCGFRSSETPQFLACALPQNLVN